jgi:hypothetical protein
MIFIYDVVMEYTDEENTVVFNALKKVLRDSYSFLPIHGISTQELGLSKSSLLLKYKNKYLFLPSPKLSIENSRLKLYCYKKTVVFSKKQSLEILNYLYYTKYIDLFSEEGFQIQNEVFV